MLWTATDKVSAVLGTIGSAFTSVGNIAKKTKLVDGKMVDIDVLKDLNENLRQTRENVDDFANRGEAALRSIIAPTNDVSNAVVGLKPVLRDVSKDAGKSLADIERRAQQWSSAHQQSAADYITASAAMLRATKNEEVSIKGTNVALMVATGATTEAGKAAATLGVLYDVVGNKSRDAGDEIGNIGDVLVRAKQIYGEGFDVGGLIDPLKDAGVTARDAKVPVSQLVGIIGAFNRGGILGGESGKAAQNVIVGLQDASAKLDFQLGKTADGGLDVVKSLQNMRDRFGDLSTMTPELRSHLEQTFGPAWRDVSMLMAQTDRLGTEFDQLGKSQGAAIQAQADAQGTLAAKLAIVNNQVDAVKVNFAQGVLPALEAATPAFGAILGPLGQFIQAHPQLTAIVGTLFVGAVGAAKLGSMMLSTGGAAVNAARGLLAFFVGTGGAASGASVLMAKLSVLGASFVAGATKAWAFTAALLANPITWIVLGIAAAAALIFIYWDPIKKFFVGLWSDVKAAFSQGWVEGILKIIELFNPVTWIAK
ncbi:MAG TPA: phage tail tape measure protein, partial [Polyangiaceae bacterium]|nr:phage tail tape measure protein [Polyangiaceae bacterium]